MRTSRLHASLLPLLLFPALAGAQGQVHVVDAAAGPGTDFTDIQPAVDAAAEDDVVLVRAGTYGGFTLQQKGLVVTADLGAQVELTGQVVVRDLTVTQDVVLRGLVLNDSNLAPEEWMRLVDNAGRLWIEDCAVGTGFIFSGTRHGVSVENCEDVSLLRCQLSGGNALISVFGPVGTIGGDGLQIDGSNVYLYDCTATGAAGAGSVSGSPAFLGGAGAVIDGGFVWASGTTFQGGLGGDGNPGGAFGPPCIGGEDGGPGLWMRSGQIAFRWLDSTFTGGAGGADPGPFCSETGGDPGPDLLQDTGLIETFPGPAHHLTIDAPVREGETADLTFGGEPGESAFLLLALAQDPFYRIEFSGILLPDEPPLVLFQGVVPPVGDLVTGIPIPSFGPAVQSLLFYGQAIFLTATPGLVLSGGSAAILLDPAF